MKLQTILFLLFSFNLIGQGFHIDSISNVPVNNFTYRANDVWGFQHSNGIEYAILGTEPSTRIYSLEDPSNPVQILDLEGDTTVWRDIKNFGDYVYVTIDGAAAGLTIIDMTDPSNIRDTIWEPILEIGMDSAQLGACHNLYIEEGFCYLAGCGVGNGGVIILDLNNNPWDPTYIGNFDEFYFHDVYVEGNLMYGSEIFEGSFGVYDITDKNNPTRVGSHETTTNFTHNAWLSDDGKYLFTTDEKPNAFVDSYDVSDLNNIQRLDSYQPLLTAGQNVIPHNTHYKDGFLYTSWYTDGIVIIDAHRPDNLIRVGQFNTHYGDVGGSLGCWGAFPFLDSGILLASDRTNGLYVLQPNISRACYFEGNAIDRATGLPIVGVKVEIVSNDINEAFTDGLGAYKTGIADAGNYKVNFTHPDYQILSVDLDMINGEVTEYLAKMVRVGFSVFDGTVARSLNDDPIEEASIFVFTEEGDVLEFISDANGAFEIIVEEGQYDIYAAKWGYHLAEYSDFDTATDPTIDLKLADGYRDEFLVDFGWQFVGSTDSGFWVRDIPNGGPGFINVPANDNPSDLGNHAMVTGNGAFLPIVEDHVTGGKTTIITPPMDLNTYDYPILTFDYWMVAKDLDMEIDKPMIVSIGNGTEFAVIAELNNSGFEWKSKQIDPSLFIDDLTNVQVLFSVENPDPFPSIILEAGIDVFEVIEGGPLTTSDLDQAKVNIYPNPAADFIYLDQLENQYERYEIYNATGKMIAQGKCKSSSEKIDVNRLSSGLYIIKVTGEGPEQNLKWVKQ